MIELRVRLASDGEGLLIVAPSGHEIAVRNEDRIGGVLIRMLYEQQAAMSTGGRTSLIGTLANPTQSMIDAFLRGGGKIQQIGKKPPPRSDVTLEELGLL